MKKSMGKTISQAILDAGRKTLNIFLCFDSEFQQFSIKAQEGKAICLLRIVSFFNNLVHFQQQMDRE